MTNSLPLHLDSRGESVRDLQRRLHSFELGTDPDLPGDFGAGTERAVADFQRRYGIEPSGVCDDHTWATLVEAGYRLGDRQLYHRSPMMRGDDIADLQRRLGALGFDPGRVDGIFGPLTRAALAEFQRNVGLHPDGISGPDTVDALQRLGADRTTAVPVSHVRQAQRLREADPGLRRRRIAVAQPGGLGALAHELQHALHNEGAEVLLLQHPDPSEQARRANAYHADVFVAVRVTDEPRAQAVFFRGLVDESPAGRRLADLVTAALGTVVPDPPGAPTGRRSPELRETQMPAVLIELGPTVDVVRHNDRYVAAIVAALRVWTLQPAP
ncbi:MAG: hypothetical protein FJW83_09570 [Actinobacteria bacterium]|nr:hypothetical protein [Actinomycetota bacterium]